MKLSLSAYLPLVCVLLLTLLVAFALLMLISANHSGVVFVPDVNIHNH